MPAQPGDPWNSLADELGLDPSESTTPPVPPPTSATPPPSSLHSQRAEEHHAPPKKPAADWNALAGNLGLEPDADFGSSSRDPVAELFGFSPSMPLEGDDRSSRRSQRDDLDENDDLGEVHERYLAENREETHFEAETPARDAEDRSDRTRSHRRGRRGRGRDRRDERGSSDRQRRASSSHRREDDRRDEGRPEFDRPQEGEIESDLEREIRDDGLDEPVERSEREPGRDDRSSKRRRRGRRGRGRVRDREENRRERSASASDEQRSESSDASLMDEPMEIEFVPLDENDSATEDNIRAESDASDAVDNERDDDDANGFHGEEHGKSSVRDIVTWKEAIGTMIEANIQNHARSPQSGHSGSHHGFHGQRDNRGRGRGRGRGGRR